MSSGRREERASSLQTALKTRGLSTPWSVTPPHPAAPSATPSSPGFAATLLGFPTEPAAPPAAPGQCCPLVSAARSAGCCESAASSQPLLDVCPRDTKKRPHSCSSNPRGVFSPKPPD